MRVFWLIYLLVTLPLLVFCCWCLFGLQPALCSTLWAGAAVSALMLLRCRATLSRQKYLAPVAVIASIASVGLGFAAILLLGAAGSIFH